MACERVKPTYITKNITYVKRIMLAIFYEFLFTYEWAFWFKVKLQCTQIKPSEIFHAKFLNSMAMKLNVSQKKQEL
jgi:hypothetical protein